MKKNILWKIMLIVGICSFILPFLLGFYRMSIESWIMTDWLILYSFIYWPTYVIGLGLILFAVCKLLNSPKKS